MTTATENSVYKKVKGVHVLRLKGSFYEMGRQHGEALKEHIPNGPLPYFREYLEKQVRSSVLGVLTPLVYPVIRQFIGKKVIRSLPAHVTDSLRGISDGSGMDYNAILDACTMPDSLLTVVSRLMKFRNIAPAVHHRLALGLGCSSAMAWGNATVDGKLYHARNFDYYSVAGWAGTSTIAFYEPDEGQKFVSATAAGVPMGGITAMNEAGLSLAVHQHMFTDRAKLGGEPIGIVGDEIMRKAENLDDAIAILKEHKPIGCWTYNIADGKNKEVLCWEEDPGRNAHRRIKTDEVFSYANVYLDSELGKTERNLYGSYWRHNQGRHSRLGAMLEEQKGQLDAQKMAAILGDEGDTDCRISEAIAMLMTVGSVVFCPEDGVVWIGTGEAPTSQGQFVAFDLAAQDAAPNHEDVDTGPKGESKSHEAFELYRQSYLNYFDKSDLPAAQASILKSVELQPEQSLYHFLAGLLALKQVQSDEALKHFDKAIEVGHKHPQRIAAFHLWRARTLDLLGRREEALKSYQVAFDTESDPGVQKASELGLKKKYKTRKARRFSIDYAFADVISP